jgi:soluble P-type ATPase
MTHEEALGRIAELVASGGDVLQEVVDVLHELEDYS